MTEDTHTLEPGSTFGKHRIVRLLGRGGMGEVYEVEHELTGDHHALKLLSSEVMEVPGALDRFEREAKVMARLKHAGIVRVDFAGEDDGRHWLRMELMPGREVSGRTVVTLEDYVSAKGGRLPESEVKALLEEILDALGHAHGKGLVHRDLKPANVLLDAERVKIADFGLVSAAGAEWMDTQVRSTVINLDDEDSLIDGSGTGSRSRAIMGTYAYMSPEQRKGRPADARSDLYAMGLMTFRMLTGLDTPGFKLPSRIIKGIDPGWDDWVERCMEENPDDRFLTAVEMRVALSFREAAPAVFVAPLSSLPKDVLPLRVSDPEPRSSSWELPPPSEMSEAGKAFTIRDLGLEMLWVKPGTFEMGSQGGFFAGEKGRAADERLHVVRLTDGFWLGKHVVTQAQWERVMGSNPSKFEGANRPVDTVSWTDVTSFCDKLTEVERSVGRLPAGMVYQLPTEAQWEYVCRAGTKTRFAFGDELTAKDANFEKSVGETTNVEKYPANGWGFHDMHGNVWEWCADWYGDYPTGAARDPVGPADGSYRVKRGGAWGITANDARSAYRNWTGPALSNRTLGFRLSLRPPASKAE